MISSAPRVLIVIASAIALKACAAPGPQGSFDQLAQHLDQRLGHRVHWNRGTEHDAHVARHVDQLLAQPLEADHAVQIALLHNRRLQALYEDIGVAQADLVQAGLLKNPVFTASARFPDRPPSGTNLEFELVGDFLDLLMLGPRRRLAEGQAEQVRSRIGAAVMDAAAEVRRAHTMHQSAKQVAAMRRLVAEAAHAAYDLAHRMAEAGNLGELEFTLHRAVHEQARLDLARAESRVREQRERLNHHMGLWGRHTAWTTPDGLPDMPPDDPPLEHLEALAIEQRLDIAAARRQLQQVAESQTIAQQYRWLTTARVGVSSERETERQWVVGPHVSIEAPIFDQRQAALARLAAQHRAAEAHLEALAIEARSAVRAARDRLVTGRQIVHHYQQVLIPLREQIVQLTQQRYNYMFVGVFEWLASKQQEFAAYEQYIEAVRDYFLAATDLEHAVGTRLIRPADSPADSPRPAPSTPPATQPHHPSHGEHKEHRP